MVGPGSYLTLRRLVRCHPWCDGADPVPPTSAVSSSVTTPPPTTFICKEVFMNDIRRTILW